MEMGTHIQWKMKPLLILCTLCATILLLFLNFNRMQTRMTMDVNKNNNNMLIEWIEPDSSRDAAQPGERGRGVKTKPGEEEASESSYTEYGFNQLISDKISLHRSLIDNRPIPCHYQKYQVILPKVSVIIIFHNEGWSTLLRTVHSVLNRSPPELLHEIVLCDDFSSKEHLKARLATYIKDYPKVKLVRTKEREGLIRARVYGADHSTGEILLFLDSHCEANVGWLPPLLSEIERDYRAVTCPSIDVIRHGDFSYVSVDPYKRGTFNWRFDYKERIITAEQSIARRSEADPVKSPVMAGGLFAISRKFWEELGKYDPGMYVWGGEQYEISFKLWMCGGKMLNIPCSRVGHVYRDKVPYTSNKMNAALINFKRVAEVWMDGFKEFLYYNRPDIKVQVHGDLSQRKALREHLKCKDFAWYLDNVANDTVRTRFEPNRAVGKIRHVKTDKCFDLTGRKYGDAVTVSSCQDDGAQKFHWTYINEFRRGLEDCIDVKDGDMSNLYLERCHEREDGNQRFAYMKKTKQIRHQGTGGCLTLTKKTSRHITLELCDQQSELQKWHMNLQDINKPIPEWAKIASLLKRYKL